MLLVEDYHMIETLPSDASNEALDVRILPWTLRCDHNFFDTHVLDALPKGHAVDTVAVTEEIAWRSWARMTRTKSTRNVTVGTVKQSSATRSFV